MVTAHTANSALSAVAGVRRAAGPPAPAELTLNATLESSRTVLPGGALERWGDTGKDELVQVTASKQPEWVDDFGDGKPAAYWDGAGDTMGGNFSATPAAWTIGLRIHLPSGQSGNLGICELATGPPWVARTFSSVFKSSTDAVTHYWEEGNKAGSALVYDAWLRLIVRHTAGGAYEEWLDGVAAGVADPTSPIVLQSDKISVGSAAGLAAAEMYLREVKIYKSALSDGDVAALDAYLEAV